MQWVVEGANPTTGRELVRQVEAGSAKEAEAIANAKGMIVANVRCAVEACENCGEKFGKLETPKEFEGHIVCAPCFLKLAPATLTMASSPLASIVDHPATPQHLATSCPNCGSLEPPVRKKNRSDAIGCLLILTFIVPAIFYYMLVPEWIFICPACGMKRGDVG